jgi:hypothetical protein
MFLSFRELTNIIISYTTQCKKTENCFSGLVRVIVRLFGRLRLFAGYQFENAPMVE